MSEPATDTSRAMVLLLAALVVGVALAASGLLTGTDRELVPTGTAALVNDVTISNEELMRALERYGSDSRQQLAGAQRDWVLQRLIEEELLVQRGIDLGLAQTKTAVRDALVQSMIAVATREAQALPEDDTTIRKWYAENAELFRSTDALRVHGFWSDSEDEANTLVAALAAGGITAKSVAAGRDLLLPDVLLAPAKLRDYLGPSATEAASLLAPGEISRPLRIGKRWLVMQVLEKESARAASYDDARELIVNAWRRDLADQALRNYIDTLKKHADITIYP